MSINIRSYSELLKLDTFEERFKYLVLHGIVGKETFGFDRYLNQNFYRLSEWKHIRRKVIVRDNGCDLGIDDRNIGGKIYVHHMNPVTPRDLKSKNPDLINPEYLISTSFNTHSAITYGNLNYLENTTWVDRKPNDTTPWK